MLLKSWLYHYRHGQNKCGLMFVLTKKTSISSSSLQQRYFAPTAFRSLSIEVCNQLQMDFHSLWCCEKQVSSCESERWPCCHFIKVVICEVLFLYCSKLWWYQMQGLDSFEQFCYCQYQYYFPGLASPLQYHDPSHWSLHCIKLWCVLLLWFTILSRGVAFFLYPR